MEWRNTKKNSLFKDVPQSDWDDWKWQVKNRIETVTSHILTPYPGTALYDRMKAEGRITTDDLSLYNTANVVFKPKEMTAEELRQGYLWILLMCDKEVIEV